MPVHRDEDFWTAFAVLLTGMLLPALVVLAVDDLLSLYISPLAFVLVAATAFWILAWVLIEHLEIDRTSFALVAIAWPWPVVFTALFGILLLHRDEQFPQGPLADVFRYLIGGAESFFLYGAVFAIAGIGAVAASRAVESRAAHDERVPNGRVIATGVALVVVAGVVIAIGANLAAASTTSIAATQPALDQHDQPALAVTIDGSSAELRLTVRAPDGSSVTRRLSRTELRQGTGRVLIPIEPDDTVGDGRLPALAGTYHLRVTALSGVIVDTATFTAGSGTEVFLRGAQVTSGSPAWEASPDRVVGTERHDTTVDVLIENAGSFHTLVSVTVGTPEDPRKVAFSNVVIDPGERVGLVVSVPDQIVESIRTETGGTATVGVYLEDPTDDLLSDVTIDLPPA